MSIGKKLCIGTLIILLLFTGLCGLIGFFAGPLVPDIIHRYHQWTQHRSVGAFA